MQEDLKRFLLISSYAPPAIGGPQNLYNLLRDLPNDLYCILTSYYNIDELSAQTGTWLSGIYIYFDNPKAEKPSLRNFAQRIKFLMKRWWLIRNLAGVPLIFGQIIAIVRHGRKTILEKNIELLIGVSDYGPALIGTYFLHKITKRPYHIFLFDLYKGNFFPFPGNFLANLFEKVILKNAEKIIVTNHKTKEFYKKRYPNLIFHDKIVIIYNSAFGEAYKDHVSKHIPTSPYTILFTGRINWPQLGALKNLVQAVDQINDLDIKLKFYSPNPKNYLARLGFNSPKIEWSVASPSEMPQIQSKADILFLPLAWHTKSPQIIDTATPGKLTDYLAAGRPILVHAPASTAVVAYAKEQNFGLTVDQDNIQQLQNAIRKLLLDQEFAQTLVINAQKTFQQNHEAEKNVKLFLSLLKK